MAGLPVVMKQKELPIVKGCATAIVTVLPPTMLDAMLRASPVTSGPDATVPWADAEPRFAAELTVKVVTDGTLVMGHGALYEPTSEVEEDGEDEMVKTLADAVGGFMAAQGNTMPGSEPGNGAPTGTA
jgi:hypothetical protein